MVQRELATEIAAPAGKTPADTPAIYHALVEACTSRGVTLLQVIETLDTGSHLPASLGRIPHHVFERCETEKSSDRHIANDARRKRRMRTAKALVELFCEQKRMSDIATGVRGLAQTIASAARNGEG